MIIDPLATAGLVTRGIRSGDRDGAPTKTAVARRTSATDRADLWEALTDKERIPRWFLPISGDLEVGGRYALEGNASGTIERCEPPHNLFGTWEYGGMVSWIELQLTPESEGRTRFSLEHIAHVDDDMWAQFGPGAVGIGWDLGLMGLRLHLQSGGQPVDRHAVEAWQTSDAGREFVTRSSDAWAEASIAWGTGAEAARAAQERVTEAYTVPPPA